MDKFFEDFHLHDLKHLFECEYIIFLTSKVRHVSEILTFKTQCYLTASMFYYKKLKHIVYVSLLLFF